MAIGGRNGWGNYIIPKETGLKEYYILKEEYTDDFGTEKVIAPIKGTSGKDRFYVMALEDINTGTYYCWYNAANGKLDNTIAYSENDFGQGITNTEYAMSKWNDSSLPWGKHNKSDTYLDMWGVIKNDVENGWFVPSKSEWAALGGNFNITSSNYKTQFGLSDWWYWSSSNYNESYSYSARFNEKNMDRDIVDFHGYVRLSTTF